MVGEGNSHQFKIALFCVTFVRRRINPASPLQATLGAESIAGGYAVRDATGQALAYVYARETRADPDTANVPLIPRSHAAGRCVRPRYPQGLLAGGTINKVGQPHGRNATRLDFPRVWWS